MSLLALACAHPPAPVEPLPTAELDAAVARAEERVPDPARGGPPIREDASPLPPFLGVDRAKARYVGGDVCAACHPEAAGTWAGTSHAHALTTLSEHSSAFNPACFRCHVTGWGHPGGFAGASTPALADVRCEACHGPASAHVAAPGPGYGELPRDASACVACHTHDTGPEFRFGEWWARIAH